MRQRHVWMRCKPPVLRCLRFSSSGQGSLQSWLRVKIGRSSTDTEDLESQRRLAEASRRALTIDYCREQSRNAVARWLRGTPIDVDYDFRRWRRHQVATRHLQLWSVRNVFRWDLLRRLIFPDLLWLGSVSGLLCVYNVHMANLATGALSLPLVSVTLPSFALGLLITFKTQSGYHRFIEGRELWNGLLRESRSLSSRILLRVPGTAGIECTPVYDAQQYALKLIRCFAIALKYHLTEDGCNPHIQLGSRTTEEDVRQATTRAFKAELRCIWDARVAEERGFLDRITSTTAANRPLQILHELELLNSSVFCVPKLGGLDPPAANEVDRSITKLHNVLGACEKILRTPIYTPYTRFTSRFLFIWCNLLPLALFPVVGPDLTVPLTLTISFFMLGIEDIGSRVEQPFDVLPLWQYCEEVDNSLAQLLEHSRALGRLPHFPEREQDRYIREKLGPFVSSISV